MRSLASYILAALVIGLALDFVAPVASIGTSSNRWPSVEISAPAGHQMVNRSGKADRLSFSGKSNLDKTVRDFAPTPAPVIRPVPEGCDPAFSPLSASARLNYASRCVADNSSGRSNAV
jgi:hypothetical protein